MGINRGRVRGGRVGIIEARAWAAVPSGRPLPPPRHYPSLRQRPPSRTHIHQVKALKHPVKGNTQVRLSRQAQASLLVWRKSLSLSLSCEP
jgi:hypothetical protein